MSKRLSVKQAKLLQQHKYILKKLASSSVKDRKTILKNAPKELFQVLNIIFRFLSDKSLNLTSKQTDQLKKHKRFLKSSRDLKSTAIKKKLQGQSGGFLPGLISLALPLISSVIKSVV